MTKSMLPPFIYSFTSVANRIQFMPYITIAGGQTSNVSIVLEFYWSKLKMQKWFFHSTLIYTYRITSYWILLPIQIKFCMCKFIICKNTIRCHHIAHELSNLFFWGGASYLGLASLFSWAHISHTTTHTTHNKPHNRLHSTHYTQYIDRTQQKIQQSTHYKYTHHTPHATHHIAHQTPHTTHYTIDTNHYSLNHYLIHLTQPK